MAFIELSYLLKRISETPKEFFNPVVKKGKKIGKNEINLGAIVNDLIFDHGGNYMIISAIDSFFENKNKDNLNYLKIVSILVYLFYDESFMIEKCDYKKIFGFLKSPKLKELSRIVDYREFLEDQERKEELARLALEALGFLPKGETQKKAKDRLTTLDSIERKKIMEKTRIAQEKARKLREALAKKKAEEEWASKMNRE